MSNISDSFINNRREYIGVFILIILISFGIVLGKRDKPEVLSSTEEMLNVDLNMDPPLDFSVFAPYSMSAINIPPTPDNVSLNLSLDLGDSNTCWDYFADGRCNSNPMTFNMTYDQNSNSYKRNIYPDQIYPEIYFAPSNITWYNSPLNTSIRRNDYHILHIQNPFSMVNDMNVWVEFNSIPVSTTNSADLQVYIVEKGHDITFFNSDWMSSTGVELLGSINKNAEFNHTHSQNTSHHLLRLGTDINGKVGNKALDISNDFWVVLYSQSPNNARGWNLRYQPSSLCNNIEGWYRGNITGWSTTAQAGCPDTHIHISRRNVNYEDTVKASVTATYSGISFDSPITTFSFAPLPNLAPNPSSFLNPIVGSIYRGDLDISWNPSSDPNPNDTLTYNISLTKTGQAPVTLLSSSPNTTLSLNTTLYEDGEYTLSGEVCDNLGLCSSFGMDGIFYIDNIVIPETLSSISITSTNSSNGYAKTGDTVSLSFESSGTILTPTVHIYSGGNSINDSITVTNVQENSWVATYEVSSSDTDGQITFEILSGNLDRIYFETTNSSNILVDNTPPVEPSSSLSSGTYISTQSITITSEPNSVTRYTTDGSIPSCSSGLIYDEAINIESSLTLKLVSCDSLLNSSGVISYSYDIKELLSYISLKSSNPNTEYAKIGDTISLSFTSSNTIETPTVIFKVGGSNLEGEVNILNTEGNTWVVSYLIKQGDPNGLISFSVSSNTLYTIFSETTDLSRVYIDTIPPLAPISSILTGTYISSQTVNISYSQSSYVRYTLDGSNPSCNDGILYIVPFGISESKVLNMISCDLAGNASTISQYLISIFPDTFVLDDDTNEQENITEEEVNDIEKEEYVDNGKIFEEGFTNFNLSDKEHKYSSRVTRTEDGFTYSVIKFRLLDSDGLPIKNTYITLYSSPQRSRTNLDGIVSFFDVTTGKHDLVLSYDGNEYIKSLNIDNPDIEGVTDIDVMDIVINDMGVNIYLVITFFLLSVISTFVISRFLFKKKN